MGDYSNLYSSNRSEPYIGKEGEEEELFLSQKYGVPIFWLALYQAGSIIPFREDVNGEEWPYLITSKASAVSNLQSRRHNIFSILPSRLEKTYEAFLTVLDSIEQPFIHMDTSAVGGLVTKPGQWREELLIMMSGFDMPLAGKLRTGFASLLFGNGLPVGWNKMLVRNDISIGKNSKIDVYSLVGGRCGEMPWEADS